MKVYLSGGMKTGWQDRVPAIDGVRYFDPRTDRPQTETALEVVSKDIHAVRDSDLIFLFMEDTNPTGYGAIWECAVAVENKIPIIAVWEKSYVDPFVACNSLYLYRDIDSGLIRLERYLQSQNKTK